MSIARLTRECPTKKQLIGILREAHTWTIDLSSRAVDAVIRGELTTVVALTEPLEEARTRRDNAMVALRAHSQVHGC